MSNEVKKSKNIQKTSMIEIAFMGAAIEQGGKILDEINKGSILEFALNQAEMSIPLKTHQIGKESKKRYIDGKEVRMVHEKADVKDTER